MQYKYVVKTGWDHKVPTGRRAAHWAGGPDGLIATGAPHTAVDVKDNWIEGAWPANNPAVKAVTDAVDAFTKVGFVGRSLSNDAPVAVTLYFST